MSEWVKVELGLPSPNRQVIACRIGKTVVPPFFATRKNREVSPWEYLDGDTCDVRITHWMYLPEMPK